MAQVQSPSAPGLVGQAVPAAMGQETVFISKTAQTVLMPKTPCGLAVSEAVSKAVSEDAVSNDAHCTATAVEEVHAVPPHATAEAAVGATGVRESPHAKLAFLDVVHANVGPVDALSFFETEWESGGLLHGSKKLLLHGSKSLWQLPDARLPPSKGETATAAGGKTSGKNSGVKYQLVTSISKGLLELGPRPLQQDAIHVGAVRGSIPFVVVCDGHGYVNLLNNLPGETPQEVRNLLHVGGRQAAEITCQAVAQYLDKYSNEFSVHTADRFFHKAFCLAHQVAFLTMTFPDTDFASISLHLLHVCAVVNEAWRAAEPTTASAHT